MAVQGTDSSNDTGTQVQDSSLWTGVREELALLRDGAGTCNLEDHGHLRLTGEDRLDFLHSQIANDVKGLPAGGLNDSLLLNLKGHALAPMRVLRGDSDIRVITEGNTFDTVHHSLDSHITFDQVTLENVAGHHTVTIQGDGAADVVKTALGKLPEAGWEPVELGGQQIIVAPSRRTAEGGYDLYTTAENVGELLGRLHGAGAGNLSRGSLAVARVQARTPTACGEGGQGVLPQE